jgi:protein-S-isoprenylcysteine O-methyltransferase Ste14
MSDNSFNQSLHLKTIKPMKGIVFFFYNLVASCASLATILYGIMFIGNLGISNSFDGNLKTPLVPALLINASLVLLFVVQRSLRAKPIFKRWWTNFIPPQIERTTYHLLTSFFLMLLMWQWQPIGGVIWEISNHTAKAIVLIIYVIGCTVVFTSTFLVDQSELTSSRQAWLTIHHRPYEHLPFRLPILSRLVRHPLYVGLLISLWSASTMTVVHLFSAMLTTLYVITAIQLEEKGLTLDS